MPLFGPQLISKPLNVTTSPISGSVGLTHTVTGISSGVVVISFGTTGGSFTGVTVIVTNAVSHSAGVASSHTW